MSVTIFFFYFLVNYIFAAIKKLICSGYKIIMHMVLVLLDESMSIFEYLFCRHIYNIIKNSSKCQFPANVGLQVGVDS
jgi:hypothetical protein